VLAPRNADGEASPRLVALGSPDADLEPLWHLSDVCQLERGDLAAAQGPGELDEDERPVPQAGERVGVDGGADLPEVRDPERLGTLRLAPCLVLAALDASQDAANGRVPGEPGCPASLRAWLMLDSFLSIVTYAMSFWSRWTRYSRTVSEVAGSVGWPTLAHHSVNIRQSVA
jgi:hypothetical protein